MRALPPLLLALALSSGCSLIDALGGDDDDANADGDADIDADADGDTDGDGDGDGDGDSDSDSDGDGDADGDGDGDGDADCEGTCCDVAAEEECSPDCAANGDPCADGAGRCVLSVGAPTCCTGCMGFVEGDDFCWAQRQQGPALCGRAAEDCVPCGGLCRDGLCDR